MWNCCVLYLYWEGNIPIQYYIWELDFGTQNINTEKLEFHIECIVLYIYIQDGLPSVLKYLYNLRNYREPFFDHIKINATFKY